MVFENVLSMVNVPTVLKRTWLVEWFYGNALKSLWDQNQVTGVGTFVMQDDVDEGFSISVAGGGSANRSTIIAANSERHFDPVNCIMESIQRKLSASDGIYVVGFGNRTDGDVGNTPDEAVIIQNSTTQTFIRLVNVRGVASSAAVSTIPQNTNFNRTRIVVTATNSKMFIDGILEVTLGTTLPLSSSKLYAGFKAQNVLAVASEARIRYMEAFNV